MRLGLTIEYRATYGYMFDRAARRLAKTEEIVYSGTPLIRSSIGHQIGRITGVG